MKEDLFKRVLSQEFNDTEEDMRQMVSQGLVRPLEDGRHYVVTKDINWKGNVWKAKPFCVINSKHTVNYSS